MVRRLVRITATAVVLAVGLVTPVVTAALTTPASADMVVDGCTIVSNPTPANFTNCPGATLAGAPLSGLNLSYADLSNAVFDTCTEVQLYSYNCTDSDLSRVNFTDANLSGAVIVACGNGPEGDGSCQASDLTDTNLSGANLSKVDAEYAAFTGATLIGANLTLVSFGDADLEGANLTGANLTGTVFGGPGPYAKFWRTVRGFVWRQLHRHQPRSGEPDCDGDEPGGGGCHVVDAVTIAGAAPGTCSTASGSTFPLFTTTVTCQVLDGDGTWPPGPSRSRWPLRPSTSLVSSSPPAGRPSAGRPYLDAESERRLRGSPRSPSSSSGGPSDLGDQVIATGTPTFVGWLAQWDSASVPNGAYTLESVATDADADTDTSTAVSLTVDNPTPTTTVVLPAAGATLKGSEYLDATASPDVASVTYELSGGPSDLRDQVIASATSTYVGWAAAWNTTGVLDGSYTLQSVASYADGVSGTSPPVTVTVDN